MVISAMWNSSASSRIWTLVVVSISCDDNHYTSNASKHIISKKKWLKEFYSKENLEFSNIHSYLSIYLSIYHLFIIYLFITTSQKWIMWIFHLKVLITSDHFSVCLSLGTKVSCRPTKLDKKPQQYHPRIKEKFQSNLLPKYHLMLMPKSRIELGIIRSLN